MHWKNISCSTSTLDDGSCVEALMFTFKICLSYATPITKCSKNHITHNVPYLKSPVEYLYHEAIILHLNSVDLLRSLVSQSTKKY